MAEKKRKMNEKVQEYKKRNLICEEVLLSSGRNMKLQNN